MTPDFKRAANTAGGKTARACDSCLRRRARWYCVADDAFLCQACDVSVHSANQLASRHEKIRLESSSSRLKANSITNNQHQTPSWHQGFTRKARTPRNNNNNNNSNNKNQVQQEKLIDPEVDHDIDLVLNNISVVVPELSCEEFFENEEEQLLYRVPVFSPFEAELCNIETDQVGGPYHDELDSLNGLFPSEMDLAEFAADVENLLGGSDELDQNFGLAKVKEEEKIHDDDDEAMVLAGNYAFDPEFINTNEGLNWNFDSTPPLMEEEEKIAKVEYNYNKEEMKRKKSSMFLRLNHEAVIAAWASQGCPWMAGGRPEINPDVDSSWPEFMASDNANYPYVGGILGGQAIAGGCDGDREARVSRYREKRRTRLFSKKIRYEVRKLNAEKRPRMKGRFVKKSSFMGGNVAAFPYFAK